MELLMLRNANFQKFAYNNETDVIVPIKYQCAVDLIDEEGNSAGNDFDLKVPLEDSLIPLGSYVCYGLTEYGGLITERYVNTQDKTVTYFGITFRALANAKGKNIITVGKNGISVVPAKDINILNYDSSQLSITFNEVLDGYKATGSTKIVSKIDEGEIGDNIVVTDKDLGISVTQTIVEKVLTIEKNKETLNYNLG